MDPSHIPTVHRELTFSPQTFCIYAFTYLFRMKRWEMPVMFRRKASSGSQVSESPSPIEAKEEGQPRAA